MIFESVRLSLVLSMVRQAAATVVAELRQGPAQLRVLRNSPRAIPLFGLPIIVVTALYTLRKQGKLRLTCACGGPEIHGCRMWVSAPATEITGANQAFLPTSFFIDVVPNCGKSPLENVKPAGVQNVVKTIRASGSLKTLIMRIGVTAEAE